MWGISQQSIFLMFLLSFNYTFLLNQHFGRDQAKQMSGRVAFLISSFSPTRFYLYHGVDSSTDNCQKMQITPASKFCTYYKSPFKQAILLYTLVNVKIATCTNYLQNWRTQLKTLQLLYKCRIQCLKWRDWSLGWEARGVWYQAQGSIRREGRETGRNYIHQDKNREGYYSLSSDLFQR